MAKSKKSEELKICEWCLGDFNQKEIFWVEGSLHSGCLACKSCIKKFELNKLYHYNKRLGKKASIE